MRHTAIQQLTRRKMLAGMSATALAGGARLRAQSRVTTLKMVETASLHAGYEQTGPDTGEPVVLLHGWPYDPRSYDGVRGPLAEAGYRVIVRYLRCFGPTVYRSASIFRSGQQAALGKDLLDLLDVLRIEKATLVGYDWGGRLHVLLLPFGPSACALSCPCMATASRKSRKSRRNREMFDLSSNSGIAGI